MNYIKDFILLSWEEFVTIFLYHTFCSSTDYHQFNTTKSYRFNGKIDKVLKSFQFSKSSYFGLAEDALFLATFQVNKDTAKKFDMEFRQTLPNIYNPVENSTNSNE